MRHTYVFDESCDLTHHDLPRKNTWRAKQVARARVLGRCVECLNPSGGFWRCLACRRKRAAADAQRQALKRQRCQELQQCIDCPAPAGINPTTGKVFWRCLRCRVKWASRKKVA